MKREDNKSYYGMRGFLVDCHRNSLPWVNFDGFDSEEFSQQLLAAHLDCVWVYAKDHWGLTYYPSNLGPMHPTLKEKGLDYTGEAVKAARKVGVSPVIYYSIDTDYYATKRHPDWSCIDPWGQAVMAGPWYRCALGHEGFTDYVLGQIKEYVSAYKPDGVFFDCYPSVLCFCPSCQEKYKKITGKDMPLGDNVHSHWRELVDYEEKHWWLPFGERLRTMLDEICEGITLSTNGCNANMPRTIRDIYDYHFAEPWAGNYLSAAWSRGVLKSPQIGPGHLGMIFDSNPEGTMARELLGMGMQGCRPMLYSEPMQNDGKCAWHEMERIGAAYKVVEQVENLWRDGEVFNDIALFYSDKSHVYSPDRIEYDYNWWNRKSSHLTSVQGAMGYAAAAHRGSRVVDVDSLFELHQRELVIVPNARNMEDSSLLTLADFIKKGGTAIVCLDGTTVDDNGKDKIFPMFEEMFGVEQIETDYSYLINDVSQYIRFDEEYIKEFDLIDCVKAVTGHRLKVKATKGEVWASFVPPSFEKDTNNEKWLAWRPPYPGEETTSPCIIHNSYGKGRVILCCFDLFSLSLGQLALETGLALQGAQVFQWPSILIKALEQKLDNIQAKVMGLPSNSPVSYIIKDNKLYVHILSYVPYGQSSRPSGVLLLNKKTFDYSKANRIYPDFQPLVIEQQGNKLRIDFTAATLYTVLELTN